MHSVFVKSGQLANRYEKYLNQKISNQKVQEIKAMSEEAAFNKGVDYLVEIIFFYGIIMAIGVYELKKAAESSES